MDCKKCGANVPTVKKTGNNRFKDCEGMCWPCANEHTKLLAQEKFKQKQQECKARLNRVFANLAEKREIRRIEAFQKEINSSGKFFEELQRSAKFNYKRNERQNQNILSMIDDYYLTKNNAKGRFYPDLDFLDKLVNKVEPFPYLPYSHEIEPFYELVSKMEKSFDTKIHEKEPVSENESMYCEVIEAICSGLYNQKNYKTIESAHGRFLEFESWTWTRINEAGGKKEDESYRPSPELIDIKNYYSDLVKTLESSFAERKKLGNSLESFSSLRSKMIDFVSLEHYDKIVGDLKKQFEITRNEYVEEKKHKQELSWWNPFNWPSKLTETKSVRSRMQEYHINLSNRFSGHERYDAIKFALAMLCLLRSYPLWKDLITDRQSRLSEVYEYRSANL